MSKTGNQVLRDAWRRRLEEHRASGLSILAFCRREGVSSASFHGWRRKLTEATTERLDSADRLPKPEPSRGFLQLPALSPRSSPWIELILTDGTQVRIPPENLSALTTLLRVLRGGVVGLPSSEASHA